MSTQDHDDPAAESTAGDSLSFDTSVAHPARIYNYWLGGKDNYEADRQAAEQAIAVTPDILPGVRANRAFLRRAVEFVAGQGIRQFLDVGTGLPTADNTHEVAQGIAARVAGRLRGQRPDRAGSRPRAADQHTRGRHRVRGCRRPGHGQDH